MPVFFILRSQDALEKETGLDYSVYPLEGTWSLKSSNRSDANFLIKTICCLH